ncbi:probable 39S ribosomal protein L45, mitochondrial [Pectinophora gossypiella]|uniref:Large ribosomal subunit protein mL45 n=1 Tax=Pectinophora gossypiella TaxID=13191 RepID=A0A1E1WBG4_PECGO|nr:probable 39S ribosomal protein L45, mitochondrial [Pectinophora gossypiella]
MASSILAKMGSLRLAPASVLAHPARTTTSKHFVPKFKKLRAQKYMKFELPDYNQDTAAMTPEKIRQKMKERGVLPSRPWMERPFYISATGGTFEPYIPPEGDGKASVVSPTRAKQAVELLEKKSKSIMAIRKIKSFEEDFSKSEFPTQAQDIYIKAHESLSNNDKKSLRLYVTEKAYPEFRHNSFMKTIRWKFLESLEPPRVVHARCTDVVSKENIFGQVTVRFHTRQQLAVYDRFGRLLHGSEILAKDVLEYVVFEKHLSNLYGTWRVHDKIIPDWAPPRDPSKLTRVLADSTQPETALEATEDKTPAIADK